MKLKLTPCQQRIVLINDQIDSITLVMLDFQRRQAEAYVVIDGLRIALAEKRVELKKLVSDEREASSSLRGSSSGRRKAGSGRTAT